MAIATNDVVEVRITEEDLEAQGPSETLRGCLVVNRLKAAGVPVVGVLALLGVQRGELTVSCDQFFGSMVYRWTE